MAIWDKCYLTPEVGVWHNIYDTASDAKMSFCQIVNMSTIDTAKIVVAVAKSDDAAIDFPCDLLAQENGNTGNTSYYYVVTAVKADGRETGPSESVEITSGADTLSDADYHRLRWSGVPGASKYRVYCRVGGESSSVIKTIEVDTTSYSNTGKMNDGERWPWVNMTGAAAILSWCELSPGTGIEPISRPIPIANGSKIMIYTTGAISVYASGEK